MFSKTIDLHYLTEEEAISKILLALYELETSHNLEEWKLITGNGTVLRDVAIELIEEQGFSWKTAPKNSGCLIVKI